MCGEHLQELYTVYLTRFRSYNRSSDRLTPAAKALYSRHLGLEFISYLVHACRHREIIPSPPSPSGETEFSASTLKKVSDFRPQQGCHLPNRNFKLLGTLESIPQNLFLVSANFIVELILRTGVGRTRERSRFLLSKWRNMSDSIAYLVPTRFRESIFLPCPS